MGPAATIAARDPTGLSLKARCSCPSGPPGSGSSSILTYPPKGIAETAHSVPCLSTLLKSTLPKPTENRCTSTPQARAVR